MSYDPKHVSVDLPEPVRRKISAEEAHARQWRMATTAYGLVTAYTLLHKLIIPLALKFTALRGTAYAKVDFWFLHSVTLLYVLRRPTLSAAALSLLCGGGIAYGVVEIGELMLGRLAGWHVFSRMLSSLPVALFCILILIQQSKSRSTALAWLGAIATFAYFGFIIFGRHWLELL